MASAADDFIEVAGTLIVFAIPVLFLLIAVGPFIYLWKKKKLTPTNIVLTLIAVIAAETLYIYGIRQGIIWLAGEAFCGIYGC